MNEASVVQSTIPDVDREALYDILTVKDVAEALGISVPCAYMLFRRSDFPSLPIAERNQKKVSRAAFERWLLNGKVVRTS